MINQCSINRVQGLFLLFWNLDDRFFKVESIELYSRSVCTFFLHESRTFHKCQCKDHLMAVSIALKSSKTYHSSQAVHERNLIASNTADDTLLIKTDVQYRGH